MKKEIGNIPSIELKQWIGTFRSAVYDDDERGAVVVDALGGAEEGKKEDLVSLDK